MESFYEMQKKRQFLSFGNRGKPRRSSKYKTSSGSPQPLYSEKDCYQSEGVLKKNTPSKLTGTAKSRKHRRRQKGYFKTAPKPRRLDSLKRKYLLQKYSGSKKVQSAAKQGERFASPEKDSMAVNRKRMTQLKKLKLIMLMDGEQTAKEEYSRSLKRIQGAMVTKRRNNDLNRSKSNKSIRPYFDIDNIGTKITQKYKNQSPTPKTQPNSNKSGIKNPRLRSAQERSNLTQKTLAKSFFNKKHGKTNMEMTGKQNPFQSMRTTNRSNSQHRYEKKVNPFYGFETLSRGWKKEHRCSGFENEGGDCHRGALVHRKGKGRGPSPSSYIQSFNLDLTESEDMGRDGRGEGYPGALEGRGELQRVDFVEEMSPLPAPQPERVKQDPMLQLKIEGLEVRISKIEKNAHIKSTQKHKIPKKLQNPAAETSRIAQTVESLKDENSRLNRLVDRLQGSLLQKESVLGDNLNFVEKVNNHNRDLAQKNQELSAMVDSYKILKSDLESGLVSHRLRHTRLQKLSNTQQSTISELRKQNESLQETLKDVLSDNRRLQNRLKIQKNVFQKFKIFKQQFDLFGATLSLLSTHFDARKIEYLSKFVQIRKNIAELFRQKLINFGVDLSAMDQKGSGAAHSGQKESSQSQENKLLKSMVINLKKCVESIELLYQKTERYIECNTLEEF